MSFSSSTTQQHRRGLRLAHDRPAHCARLPRFRCFKVYGWRFTARQRKHEARSAARRTLGPDPTVMRFHNGLRYREA
jgi:hypothetical protein